MNFVESLELFHVSAKEIPCLTGRGAPTVQTEGVPGVLYMDTDSGGLYKCRGGANGAYRWEMQGGSAELTDADKAEIVAMVLDALGGKVISGYVDSGNNIIITGLRGGSYTVKYEMEDGSTIDIGDLELDADVYYSITNNLTNCVNSNGAGEIAGGGSYFATITANSGYALESVVVTMGGDPVSVSGGSISIAGVTGDIVITAVAAEVQAGTGYTNLANPNDAYWKDDCRISMSSGGTSACTGRTVTNFIPAEPGDVLRVRGMHIADKLINSQDCKIMMYTTKDSESSKLGGLYGALADNEDSYADTVTIDGAVSTITLLTSNVGTQPAGLPSMKCIRIDGVLMDGYTKNDVIITINEPIG